VIDRARVVKFNLWPDRKRKPYYWKVFIFESRKAMMIFWREQCRIQGRTGKEAREDFGALTQSWTILSIKITKSKRWVQDNSVGQMLFYRQHLGAGVVAHECLHAALKWAQSLAKIQVESLYVDETTTMVGSQKDGNERLCAAEQRMVSQFWRAFYKLAPRHWYVKR